MTELRSLNSRRIQHYSLCSIKSSYSISSPFREENQPVRFALWRLSSGIGISNVDHKKTKHNLNNVSAETSGMNQVLYVCPSSHHPSPSNRKKHRFCFLTAAQNIVQVLIQRYSFIIALYGDLMIMSAFALFINTLHISTSKE